MPMLPELPSGRAPSAPSRLLPASDADRLSDRDYRRLADLIGEQVGIKLPPAKRVMVEGRLRKRVRGLGYDSVTAYCRFLFDGDGLESELVHLIDVVTTNKTDFFREPEHFEMLAKEIVPSLLARRARTPAPLLKIWSAASSTGAEAYSIAMVLADLSADLDRFRFAVLGTDISTDVLKQAVRAVYPSEMTRPIPPEMQCRYLLHARDPHAREVRIVPELRRHVRFARLNLMDATYPFDRDVDVIFLRNVLIYFEKPMQEAVVRRLVGHLRPGGYLILGHSESMIATNLKLRQRAPSVFQLP